MTCELICIPYSSDLIFIPYSGDVIFLHEALRTHTVTQTFQSCVLNLQLRSAGLKD